MATHSHYITRGRQYSLFLHAGLLVVMIFGLPSFLHKRIEPEPVAISVEILPMAPVSNVKPQEQEEPKDVKKPVEEKKTARKATVESKKVEVKPKEIPIPVKAKDVVIPEKKKPEPKPKPVKKEEKDELDSILKSVEQTAKAEESKKPTEKVVKEPTQKKAESSQYNDKVPLSMSETDAIRNQIQKCWNPPAGAKDAANLIVTLHISVNQDGSVSQVDMAGDRGRYNSDSFFRAAADSAMRAVHLCSPLKNLPAEKFGTWHDMEMTFDPKDL